MAILSKPVFGKVDEVYWRSRRMPWHIGLRMRVRWLQAVKWWHLLLASVLFVGGSAAWLALRPLADSDTRIIARIDGSPITESDLIAEAGRPVRPEQRRAVLDAVIDRRLLAAAAGKDGAARRPTAEAAMRKAGETVLAGAIAQRIVGEVKVDDAQAKRFIAAHPAMFAERQVLLIDAGPIDPAIATGPALKRAETLDAAEIALRPTGAAFVHQLQVIDTGAVPAELAAQLVAVAPGRLFMVQMGGQAMLGAVIERTPLVMPEAIQLEQARAGAAAEIRVARLKAALKAMRAKAKISIGQ